MKILWRIAENYVLKCLFLTVFTILLLQSGSNANATLLNFDDQGLVGPSYISGPPYDSPEAVNVNDPSLGGDITFENGRVFTNASGVYTNNTSIYANLDYGTYTSNLIRIVFPTSITSYSLDIINAVSHDIEYQVRDNLGNAQNYTIIPNSLSSYETVGVTNGAGINQIEIEALTDAESLGYSLSWSFAIDNLTYDTAVIPEPASLLLFGSGLVGFWVLRRR